MKSFFTILIVLISSTAFSQTVIDYSTQNKRSEEQYKGYIEGCDETIQRNKDLYLYEMIDRATLIRLNTRLQVLKAEHKVVLLEIQSALKKNECYDCEYWIEYDKRQIQYDIEAAERAEKRRLSEIERKKQIAKEQAAIKAAKQLNIDKSDAWSTYEKLRDLGKQTIEYKSEALSQYEVSKKLTEGSEWHTRKIEMALEAYNLYMDAYVELIDIVYTKESEFTKEMKLLKKTFPDLFAKLRYGLPEGMDELITLSRNKK
jgi:hypothetical protein